MSIQLNFSSYDEGYIEDHGKTFENRQTKNDTNGCEELKVNLHVLQRRTIMHQRYQSGRVMKSWKA